METKKNKEKITSEYLINMLDNGIVLEDLLRETMECATFEKTGDADDPAMQNFVGKCFWQEILCCANSIPSNRLKIILTIEER